MSMFEATLSSSQTYSGTAFATVTGLALTPGAGTYLAVFVGPIGSAISGEYHYVGLAVDGSDIAHTEREHHNESSIADAPHYTEMMTHAVITVGAGEEIQARWRASATGDMTMPNGSLTLISVVSGDTGQVTATADDTGINTTPAQVDGMVFSDPGAGDYLAVFSCSGRGGTITDTLHIGIYVGGTLVAHSERRWYVEGSVTAVTSYPLMVAAEVSPTAGQDVQVYAWTSTGSAAIIHERTFSLLANRTVEQTTDTVDDTESTSGTDKAIDSMYFVTPINALPAGDYLLIGTGVFQFGSLGVSPTITLKILNDGVEVTNSARTYVWNDSLDNMDRCLAIAQKVVSDGSGIAWNWRCSTTDTRTAQERTFIALLDAAAATREQEGYRFRDDDDDEANATWLATQDTNITRPKETNTRLRTLVDTSEADPPAEGLELEYRKVGDPATEWRKVPLT